MNKETFYAIAKPLREIQVAVTEAEKLGIDLELLFKPVSDLIDYLNEQFFPNRKTNEPTVLDAYFCTEAIWDGEEQYTIEEMYNLCVYFKKKYNL